MESVATLHTRNFSRQWLQADTANIIGRGADTAACIIALLDDRFGEFEARFFPFCRICLALGAVARPVRYLVLLRAVPANLTSRAAKARAHFLA